MLTPKNFYKPATIQNNLMNSSALDSTTEFLVSESFLDRVDTIDIDASLKLSFMSGLIKISGSARYLNDGQYILFKVQMNISNAQKLDIMNKTLILLKPP